jgi:hypothetical protein
MSGVYFRVNLFYFLSVPIYFSADCVKLAQWRVEEVCSSITERCEVGILPCGSKRCYQRTGTERPELLCNLQTDITHILAGSLTNRPHVDPRCSHFFRRYCSVMHAYPIIHNCEDGKTKRTEWAWNR